MLTSRLLLVVFVCGFCGCDSDNPASDATTTQPDDRLLGGYWYEVDDGDAVNGAVQVEPVEGEPGKYLLVGWNAQGIVRDEETTECITTQIDGEFYFSGRVVKPNDSSEGWGLYKYRFTSPDRFEVRSISRDRVAAAIQAGRIRGTVHHGRGLFGGIMREPRIAATTEELRGFLEEEGADLFDNGPTWVEERRPQPPAEIPPKPEQKLKAQHVVTAAAIVALFYLLKSLDD